MEKLDSDVTEVILALPATARVELMQFLEGPFATGADPEAVLETLMTSISQKRHRKKAGVN